MGKSIVVLKSTKGGEIKTIKHGFDNLIKKIKTDAYTANKDDSIVIENMTKAQNSLLEKSRIAQLIVDANEDIGKYIPLEYGWIIDFQSVKDIEGSKISFEYIDKNGARSDGVEVESSSIKELSKKVQDIASYIKENFTFDPTTGKFAPRYEMHGSVKGFNESFNVYCTLSGIIGTAKTLSSEDLDGLNAATKLSIVSQITQISLGTVELASKVVQISYMADAEQLLSMLNNWSRGLSVIAPVFDVINVTTLSIALADATLEEQVEIITNLVLGASGAVLALIGQAIAVLKITGLASDVLLSSVFKFLEPVGDVLDAFNIIGYTKKEAVQDYDIKYKSSLAKLYYAGGKLEAINSHKSKIISRSNDKVVRFEPSLVIKNIKITNQNVVITPGDILFDDMRRSFWPELYSYWDYDDPSVGAGFLQETRGWNRVVGKVSLYKPMLKNIMKKGRIEEEFIINKDDLVVLPGKAQQILHQGFGTTEHQVNQVLDTDNSDKHIFTDEEIFGGVKIKNFLISEYPDKYPNKSSLVFSPICKCKKYNSDNSITLKPADVRNITVEYVYTKVNIELDSNSYSFLISPESVDDSKFLYYSFQGSGSGYVIILPSKPVSLEINSIADVDKIKDEIWVFNISKQVINLSQLLELPVTLSLNAISIGNQHIKIKQIHGQIIFKIDFKQQVISEILFEVDIINNKLVLHNMTFNEEYISVINDKKIKDIKGAINAISKIFIVPHPILIRHNGFPGFYWSGNQLLLSLAHPNTDKELMRYLQKEQSLFYQLQIQPVREGILTAMMPYVKNPLVNMIKKDYPEINTLYEIYLESSKNNYLFCNSVKGNILNTNGSDLVIDKITGVPMVITNFVDIDIKGQYLHNIVDGRLVTCIINIEVVNAGIYDSILSDLYRYPGAVEKVLRISDAFSFDANSEVKYITLNLIDSSKNQSNLVFDIKSSLRDSKVISGEILRYGKNADEEYYVREKINKANANLIPIEVQINVLNKHPRESRYYHVFNKVLNLLNTPESDSVLFTSLLDDFSGLLDLFDITIESLDKGLSMSLNFTYGHEQYKSMVDFSIDNKLPKAEYIEEVFGDYYENLYTIIDDKKCTYFYNVNLNTSDIKIMKDTECTVLVKKMKNITSSINIDTKSYKSLHITFESNIKALVQLNVRELYYSISGTNIILITPEDKTITLVNVLYCSTSEIKLVKGLDINESINIWDIRYQLKSVAFNEVILDNKCLRVHENQLVFLDKSNNEVYLDIKDILSLEV